MDAEGQGGNNIATQEGTPGIDPGSNQTVEEIAQEIDSIPVYAQANDTPSVEHIDAADMATGTGVEGNVSHPDNLPTKMLLKIWVLAKTNSRLMLHN